MSTACRFVPRGGNHLPVSNHTIIPFSATEQRNVCIHGLIVGECRSVVEEVQKLVEEERMRLQEFYERMNKSFVEDAETFTRWEKHRSILAKYIRELLSLSDIKRILVVGSGNCYDLDLHVFNEHEVVVTFIDIDAEATRRAIEDREPMLLQKANIIQMDILGWNDTLESIKAVFAQGDTQEILRAFKQARKKFRRSVQSVDEMFDAVIILPLFTQLVAPYLLSEEQNGRVWLRDHRYPVHKIHTEIQYLSDLASRMVLDRLYENVRPGGYLLAICELFNAFEHPYRNHFISRYGVNALDAINYAIQHGVYNGCKGFLGWFHEKRETFSDMMTAGWLWDFDEYIMYAVLMNRVRKTDAI